MGYGTAKEVAQFKLEGMTCAACANRIEKSLSKLPGVTNATVNFAMETARVEYSPGEVSITEMQNKVKQIGYKAISKEDHENTGDRREKNCVSKTETTHLSLTFITTFMDDGCSFFFHFMDLYTGDFHESMVSTDLGNPSSILYR